MRNKTYTQEQIISFIKEALEEFTHIIDSKYITKSEFTKFNKFFKNLLRQSKKKKNVWFDKVNPNSKEFFYTYPIFHTYEDTKCMGKHIELNHTYVPDLDINEIYKKFPLLIENHELLLSLKESIKPGRRPKDLEKDYEKERLEKAAKENKATCGICHNYWELVDYHGKQNIIADHGFNIAHGYRDDNCFGARFKSWEKSTEAKVEYVRLVLKPALKDVLNSKPSQATVDALIKMVNQYKIAYDAYWALTREERQFKEPPEAPEYLLPGQRVGYTLSRIKNINLSLITEVWVEHKSRLEHQIKTFEKQITEWILKPTPREQRDSV
jgi:hypothetical protein